MADLRANAASSFSIALVGKGGTGVITAGEMLLAAAARAGCYGLMTRAVGPQIRGGEAAALIRLSTAPVHCLDDRFDILLGIDWLHAERFCDDLPLDANSLVISDSGGDAIPAEITVGNPRIETLPLAELASEVPGGRSNMVALGLLSRLAGLATTVVDDAIREHLSDKNEDAIKASQQSAQLGATAAANINMSREALDTAAGDVRWRMTGNQAAGLGAIRGGIRFAAAYPITPATEILEWLAPRLHDVGGTLVQAEDELASINMVIGAAWSGVPSLTATSGPGFSLMIEGLGLAVGAEVPVVVIDVMRGGPSTGIPTKSEQSDLNTAIYGMHGDAPHLVLAPNSVADCSFTTQWAVHLAEATQAPAIVLSDQFLGQASMVLDPIANVSFFAHRKQASEPAADYQRYAITADGISPMALPGTPCGQYTADGLEHSTRSLPSSGAADHLAQTAKRARKLADFNYGQHWADIEGDAELAVITWGSTTGAVREAIQRLTDTGLRIKMVSIRLLAPEQPEQFAAALAGIKRAIVIEQNDSGQLFRYLRGSYDLPCQLTAFHRTGPSLFRPGEIAQLLLGWSQQ